MPLESVFCAMSATGSGLSAAYGGRSFGNGAFGPAIAAPAQASDTASASSVRAAVEREDLLLVVMVAVSLLRRCGGCGRSHHRSWLAVDHGAVGLGEVGLRHALHIGGG